jgi:class 3 adenylate cyclase/pimeloyl-ACP methyl ester carboxylesterase
MTDFDLPETRYAQSGDISIAYQVVGEGERDIIVIPGVISHLEAMYDLPGFAAFQRRLSTIGRIINFDKRGQGLSDRVSGVPTLEERMDDVRAVMDAAGSARAALIGFSEGSAMSILFAATYPDRVSHLVLQGGFARARTADMSNERFNALLDMIVGVWGKGQMMRTVVGVAETDAAAIARLGKFERLSCSPGAMKTAIQMNNRIDVTPILPSVRVPTLVLHSRADARVSVDCGRTLAAGIPGAKYIEYDNLPHGVWAGEFETVIGDIEEFVTGQRDGAIIDSERVLSTVLFTDIVGSTRRAVELGDHRWREMLDRHDRLARRTIGAHRGRLVEIAGDGVLATFDGPGRAVRCALAFGSAAQQEGLPLRAGLHTGEIELRGERVGGVAVHAAARVMAQAGPNEVLVSRVVTDLVAGAGLKFSERGVFDLKGIPGRWELFAASA